jgi:hypothetical protein
MSSRVIARMERNVIRETLAPHNGRPASLCAIRVLATGWPPDFAAVYLGHACRMRPIRQLSQWPGAATMHDEDNLGGS